MTKSLMMRALVLESYNSAFVLTEIARPTPGEGQVSDPSAALLMTRNGGLGSATPHSSQKKA
jgi:hypothetical protein